ncbi:NPP1-domain-containing protein [Eremomyces bilateralis CBS 781.70]|uniref:NPP1-domain-containing protein n=1 Tax=Eremomyces bilateralis CBS 781.70 TaxID=1392243 RepID=A0A6G1GHH7_9PEZI|nr:NPP1-domain-containing protein [Eremomyces bilateralis CBS 781.70]KAF1817396.1 NPP1-domain-containing protein [Eremomyces bilateralis CBS 781.70]
MRNILSLLVAANAVCAWPFQRRAVLGHDQIVGFPQTVPSGTAGELYLKFQPWLEVYSGCVPFAAVDADGNTSGGLAKTGKPNERCGNNIGQVYARIGTHNGQSGIMYSWYMPKDSPSSGFGHRHEWENVVVWLSEASMSATATGMSVSQHGGYQKSEDFFSSGSRPLVGYLSIWPINHQMIFTPEKGGEQPLIAWESLPGAARSALENTNFGDATVPFKESTFAGNLEKAAL